MTDLLITVLDQLPAPSLNRAYAVFVPSSFGSVQAYVELQEAGDAGSHAVPSLLNCICERPVPASLHVRSSWMFVVVE